MAYTTIDDPSAHFQTVLYTGNASDGHAITFDGNSDLQPDWVWIKPRSFAGWHVSTDTSRGLTKNVYPNDTYQEETNTTRIQSMNSDGFTINNDADTINKSSQTIVAWAWKANGGTRTTNTESGDNPAGGYQANTTAGFSIVDWTGTGGAGGLMAHGLGAVPHTIITKTRSHANSWAVYHHRNTAAPETDYLKLDSTAATLDNVNRWNDTVPTSTNLVFGDVGGVNGNDQTQIAYVFTEKQGYSKFGSYTGNGNADGPFIYLGFKPAWAVFKNTTSGHSWRILDNRRNTHNSNNTDLRPDVPDAESSSSDMDFLSNGIKMRDTDGDLNEDGSNHVYMAFAEHPFVSSKGIPTTAR